MENRVSRFDDLVRTERYFSATLLPAILFHRIDEAQDGLKAFLRLTSKSVQETGKSQVNWDPPSVLEADEIEVITEFHIARDLEHADLPLGETETSKRDAPDLVIIVADHLLVCEAKFLRNAHQAISIRNLRRSGNNSIICSRTDQISATHTGTSRFCQRNTMETMIATP